MSCACEDGRACPACRAQDEWDYQVLNEPDGYELDKQREYDEGRRRVEDEQS